METYILDSSTAWSDLYFMMMSLEQLLFVEKDIKFHAHFPSPPCRRLTSHRSFHVANFSSEQNYYGFSVF